MSLASCLYEGEVRHRRLSPLRHEFRYRLFMLYVDLEELPTLFRGRWLWSVRGPNLAWFRRADYLGPPNVPLGEAVRDLVESRLGWRPTGPIRLLTHFRYFGLGMNPISLFYCFDSRERVAAIVAEVTNTPWGEQCHYVLDARRDPDDGDRAADSRISGALPAMRAVKVLHVSPFFEMAFEYEFQCTEPGSSLVVQIGSHPLPGAADGPAAKGPAFEATLQLARRPLTGAALARALCRHPLLTARVLAAIYWQAFRLWRKGAAFVPHPQRVSPQASQTVHTGVQHKSLAVASSSFAVNGGIHDPSRDNIP
ncbi:MAG: DUF1365 domain-containing protein [Planctomycetales bacterium]